MERIPQRYKKVTISKDKETSEVKQVLFTVPLDFYKQNQELFGTEQKPTFFTVTKDGDEVHFASGALPQKMPKPKKFEDI